MTTLSQIYFILGLVALFWPLATLLFKRRVYGAQWLIMTTIALAGLSIIVYSTFFNSFLNSEFLLMLLFMITTLTTPPMAQLSITAMTRREGVSRRARAVVLPSVVMALVLIASVAVGGADMYRLWIERGAEDMAGHFYPNSWRYNVIVAVHYYGYSLVMVAEILFVVIYCFRSLRRHLRTLGEYYTASNTGRASINRALWAILVVSVALVLQYILFPFNSPRPVWVALLFSVVEGVAIIVLGYESYHHYRDAEQLQLKAVQYPKAAAGIAQTARRVADMVENDRMFLNPDLSVFMLAKQLKVAEDDVIDAVHHIHGTNFGDYIDGLRVDYALHLLLREPDFDPESAEQMAQLAHRCGFLNAGTFASTFSKLVQQSVAQWYRGG